MTLLNGCIDPQLPSDVFVSSGGSCALYRASQMQEDLFWKCWRLEYLSMLQKGNKWIVSRENIYPNSLVLLKKEYVSENSWPRGVILFVTPHRDGICRQVVVRTVNRKNLSEIYTSSVCSSVTWYVISVFVWFYSVGVVLTFFWLC